jgi:probable rRNA maturation factor
MRSSSSHIKVINSNKFFSLNVKFIESIAATVLKSLKKDKVAEVDIVFVDDAAIKKLNKRYKKEDGPTDVLSFAIDGREFRRREVLGEIFISLDTARRNSKLFDVEFEHEIVRYVVHGILHLFDYDDQTKVEKARMWHRQEKILGEICKQGTLSKVLTRR